MTIAISKRNGAFQHLKNPLKQNGRLQTFLTIVNLIIIFSSTGTLIYQSKASLDRFLGYETKAILTGNVLYNFKDLGQALFTTSSFIGDFISINLRTYLVIESFESFFPKIL